MKKKIITIGSLVAASLLSCGKKDSAPIRPVEQMRSLSTINVSARVNELVKNNDVIDIDVARISSSPDKLSNEDYAEVKAAVYRFYRNVKVENGRYVYHGSKVASDLKLSDRLFKAFLKNLNDINKSLDEQASKGEDVDISPVDSTYLSSLLH